VFDEVVVIVVAVAVVWSRGVADQYRSRVSQSLIPSRWIG